MSFSNNYSFMNIVNIYSIYVQYMHTIGWKGESITWILFNIFAIFIKTLVDLIFHCAMQAAQDGVDIISLSITPNRRPPGIATFFNPIDMALLSAVKAGIFVVQAAGNTGPSPRSMSSFSPWIFTVGAASHDRTYTNSLLLGNNVTVPGMGLARKFVF